MNPLQSDHEEEMNPEDSDIERTIEIVTAHLRRGSRGRVVELPRWVQ